MENSATKMPIVIGITRKPRLGAATFRPSTALNTEMAGVMTPSPHSNAAPNRPSITSTAPRPDCRNPLLASAISARMPPSPLLSARRTYNVYLIEMMIVRDQKINDNTPSTLLGVTCVACSPWKHSRMAYSGLVPISP